jgi:hypothetical protein
MPAMPIQQAVNNVFVQLSGSLDLMSQEEYVKPCTHLSNSTIGQHVRHIIEMFQCLENGYESGVVNYELRKRDKEIETQKEVASKALHDIFEGLGKPDKALSLEGVYNDHSNEALQIPTNYYREIIYNLEHTIHHMALIRIGIREIKDIELPESYGVASATVKHKRSCAQ